MLKAILGIITVLILTASVHGYGLTCTSDSLTTATLLYSQLSGADGNITLDNLGFTPGASVWLSENLVPLTIATGGSIEIKLNGTGCKVGDNQYYSSPNYWDGMQFWNDASTKPGFYIQGQGLDFICTLSFYPPISKFSAYVSSFEGTTGAIFIYDKSGDQIDCSADVPQTYGVNSYNYRGFESPVPIHAVTFSYGYMTADSIQYKQFCASGYNPYFDNCSGRKYHVIIC